MWMIDASINLVNLADARSISVVENDSKSCPGSHILAANYPDGTTSILYRGSQVECKQARTNVCDQMSAALGYVINHVSQDSTQDLPTVMPAGEMAGQAEGWLNQCQ